jgi:hypothetical protein
VFPRCCIPDKEVRGLPKQSIPEKSKDVSSLAGCPASYPN